MTVKLLEGKRIVLGVTGSIACYKAVELASRLTQDGAKVDVILTESASRFVSQLAFHSVTGRRVYSDMWELEEHVSHVRLGESADILVIAPATAHTIAKMAKGLADNFLTVTALAARCPILIAPAMDGGMFEHPATQANVALLQERGAIIAGPAMGRMASGLVGLGRLLEARELVGHIRLVLGRQGPLAGRRIVVTAGPTREALDPVRFLSNRSSGRQGFALAQSAIDAGAHVTLVAGPVELESPVGANVVRVTAATELESAVLDAANGADALLMAAAVSDFRPAVKAEQKIKKKTEGSTGRSLLLEKNPDILEEIKAQRERTGFPRITVGFAAETENVVEHGRDKLIGKGLDLIAVNDVSANDAGFAVDTNRITIIRASGNSERWPLMSKEAVADRLTDMVADLLAEGSRAATDTETDISQTEDYA